MQRTQHELQIGGMTCAACAARIEKKLNRIAGVEATVNYATERANISAAAGVTEAELIATVEKTGYTATEVRQDTEQADLAALKIRVIIAAALTIPVVLIAMVPPLQFDYWGWVSLALTLPVVFWAGLPFHIAAFKNARHGSATMDTLISIGTLAATLWSTAALLFGHAGMPGMRHTFTLFGGRSDPLSDIYFEVAAGVITFVLLGRYFEKRAKSQAGSALYALLDLGAKQVTVLRDGAEQLLPISELVVGDEFVVRPGEKIATDGVVLAGASAVDESMLTGESVPAEVSDSSTVTGGTLNTSGRLVVRATQVGSATKLAQMTRLVTEAQAGKAQVQKLADRVASVFVPVVLGLAVLTLASWVLFSGDWTRALAAAISVLIIACPCALGLATPTALLAGTGRGAELGILIRGAQVLETSANIDTIVLDKTGTVTTGNMAVTAVTPVGEFPADRALSFAAALESASEHPVARAIVVYAKERDAYDPDLEVTDFRNEPGVGVSGEISGVRVKVGRPGVTVYLDGTPVASIEVSDQIKPESAQAVSELHKLGFKTVLLSGDKRETSEAVAAATGIQNVVAEVLPAEKVATVKRLQNAGQRVAMIGDGVNDAPALATANLGIAMGTGTDAAINAADITLMRADLPTAVTALRLSQRTLKTIKTNLFWAFAYNTAAIPLAAFGLLNPMLAGAAMALSSVFVVSNSLRLRRFNG
ncbi:heavy metal translocating P-type ATPase [Canibacter zhoujuaniae]|uniref:heavy metal translocating P-type ATPase n=1 Tax=Canibacter zhoujuaniae TaxID=2708343 RepID=UPI001423F206|nr:heavy metal translocating P-type ATPase [Canibacter zhoujuaniae]